MSTKAPALRVMLRLLTKDIEFIDSVKLYWVVSPEMPVWGFKDPKAPGV